MRFFEAAANWADRMSVDVKFARDEYDGWFAILAFSDARGPYSGVVNAIAPRQPETDEAFCARVDKMMSDASVKAHRSRIHGIRHAKAA
jgi:hypothetical protein